MALDDPSSTPAALIADMAARARAAVRLLAAMPSAQKAAALRHAAAAVRTATDEICLSNADDMAKAIAAGLSAAMLDRLRLDPARVAGAADVSTRWRGLLIPSVR